MGRAPAEGSQSQEDAAQKPRLHQAICLAAWQGQLARGRSSAIPANGRGGLRGAFCTVPEHLLCLASTGHHPASTAPGLPARLVSAPAGPGEGGQRGQTVIKNMGTDNFPTPPRVLAQTVGGFPSVLLLRAARGFIAAPDPDPTSVFLTRPGAGGGWGRVQGGRLPAFSKALGTPNRAAPRQACCHGALLSCKGSGTDFQHQIAAAGR